MIRSRATASRCRERSRPFEDGSAGSRAPSREPPRGYRLVSIIPCPSSKCPPVQLSMWFASCALPHASLKATSKVMIQVGLQTLESWIVTSSRVVPSNVVTTGPPDPGAPGDHGVAGGDSHATGFAWTSGRSFFTRSESRICRTRHGELKGARGSERNFYTASNVLLQSDIDVRHSETRPAALDAMQNA